MASDWGDGGKKRPGLSELRGISQISHKSPGRRLKHPEQEID